MFDGVGLVYEFYGEDWSGIGRRYGFLDPIEELI